MVNAIKNRTTIVIPCDSPMGRGEGTAHPKNCRQECPYGKGKAYCFPCMKKIMGEHMEAKKA